MNDNFIIIIIIIFNKIIIIFIMMSDLMQEEYESFYSYVFGQLKKLNYFIIGLGPTLRIIFNWLFFKVFDGLGIRLYLHIQTCI
jgi:hypothetical protein